MSNLFLIDSIKNGIIYGFIIFLCIIAVWIWWAKYKYRYSDSRLSTLILNKYQSVPDNKKILTDYLYYSVSNIRITDDKKYIYANVSLLDKKTKDVKLVNNVVFKLNENCSLIDFNCINV